MAPWSLWFTLVPLCSDFLSRSKQSFQISFFEFCYLLFYEWKITLDKKLEENSCKQQVTQRAHKLHVFCLLTDSFLSLKKPEKTGPLFFFFLLLCSNWAKMKLIIKQEFMSFEMSYQGNRSWRKWSIPTLLVGKPHP